MKRTFTCRQLPTILLRKFSPAGVLRQLKRTRTQMFVLAAIGGLAAQTAQAGNTFNESSLTGGDDFGDTLATATDLPAGTSIVNGESVAATDSGDVGFFDFVDFNDCENGAFTIDFDFVVGAIPADEFASVTVTAFDGMGTQIGSTSVPFTTLLAGETVSGSLTGTLANAAGNNTMSVAVISSHPDGSFGFDGFVTAQGTYSLDLTASHVPEPGSAGLLLAAGALGMCFRRRRKPISEFPNGDSPS